MFIAAAEKERPNNMFCVGQSGVVWLSGGAELQCGRTPGGWGDNDFAAYSSPDLESWTLRCPLPWAANLF
jgi:hypothetical protein